MTTATKKQTLHALLAESMHPSARRWRAICQSPMVRDGWEIHELLRVLLARIEAFGEAYDGEAFGRYLSEAGVADDSECWGNSCTNLLYDVRGLEWTVEMALSVLGGELPGDPDPEPKPARRKPR